MAQAQEQVNISVNDLILTQLRDLKENQRDLKVELKDVRQDLKETRKELDELRKEINGRIDNLANKIDSSSNHGQTATITTIGIGLSAVSITLGVLYALIFK